MVGVLVAVIGVVWWLARGGDPAAAPARQPEDNAEATLDSYLDALAREDYPTAAGLLAVGDEPLARRSDLARLKLTAASANAIAQGLAEYCSDGCLDATGVADIAAPDSRGEQIAVVEFGEPRGHPLQRSFIVGETDDGQPYVRGLPPAGTGTLPRI